MKHASWFIVLGLFLGLIATGCGGDSSGGRSTASGANATGSDSGGHVDVGAELEINILVVKLKVWGVVRDADVLAVRAYDWAARKVRYLLNGEEHEDTLTAEQAAELARDVEKAKAK